MKSLSLHRLGSTPPVRNMTAFWHMDVEPLETLNSIISKAFLSGAPKFVPPPFQRWLSHQIFTAFRFLSVIGRNSSLHTFATSSLE